MTCFTQAGGGTEVDFVCHQINVKETLHWMSFQSWLGFGWTLLGHNNNVQANGNLIDRSVCHLGLKMSYDLCYSLNTGKYHVSRFGLYLHYRANDIIQYPTNKVYFMYRLMCSSHGTVESTQYCQGGMQ